MKDTTKFAKFQLKKELGNGLKLFGWHRSRDGRNVRLLLVILSPDDRVLGHHTVKFADNGNRAAMVVETFNMMEGFLRARGVTTLSWEFASDTIVRVLPKIIHNFL